MGKPDAVERLHQKVRWYGYAPEDLAFYERATVGDLRAMLAYVAELEGALRDIAGMTFMSDKPCHCVEMGVKAAAALTGGEKGGG